MQKTVNQWLDWIGSLPKDQRESIDIFNFRNELVSIKHDQKYKGYGWALMVTLPENLEDIMEKSK
jgi:hypothetical protein